MLRGAAILLLTIAAIKPLFADTSELPRDSHPLSREEMQTFLPLVCLGAVPSPVPSEFVGVANFNCNRLFGYRYADPASIALSAIAYGSFTRPGANEAYISYFSGREPHSNDFGGGILFSRSGKPWRLIRWYPGLAMQNCLALPGQGQQEMLCLTSHTAQGEIDTSVWIEKVGYKSEASLQDVIKAQDDREALDPGEASPESYPCVLSEHGSKAMLLSIDSLSRSTIVAEFARSRITYATAEDVSSACKSGHFESVRTTIGTVRYLIKGGKLVVNAPADFSKTDY